MIASMPKQPSLQLQSRKCKRGIREIHSPPTAQEGELGALAERPGQRHPKRQAVAGVGAAPLPSHLQKPQPQPLPPPQQQRQQQPPPLQQQQVKEEQQRVAVLTACPPAGTSSPHPSLSHLQPGASPAQPRPSTSAARLAAAMAAVEHAALMQLGDRLRELEQVEADIAVLERGLLRGSASAAAGRGASRWAGGLRAGGVGQSGSAP